MTLVRWDPFRELEDVSDRLNRMFARPAASRTNGKETMIVADWTPSVDISETEGEYQIKAEIPDVKKEDVKVTLGRWGSHDPRTTKARKGRQRDRSFIGSSDPTAVLSEPSHCPM